MVNCFFTNCMANEDLPEPVDALIPKISFSFFAQFWVWVPGVPSFGGAVNGSVGGGGGG